MPFVFRMGIFSLIFRFFIRIYNFPHRFRGFLLRIHAAMLYYTNSVASLP